MGDRRALDHQTSQRQIQVSRRELIGGATVLSLGGALAVSAKPVTLRAAAAQTDPATFVIADNMSTGGLWLTLDPGHFYEINPSAAMNLIYEPLYHLPDSSEPDQFEPLLADGMPELSADGRQATIRLKPNVTFQTSGNPMTAQDWVFSWTRVKNLKGNPSYLAEYWEGVEAVDDLTLRLTLAEPNPALTAILTSLPLSVVDSARVRENGGTDAPDADQTDTAREYINENSVGTGPFIVAQWDVNSEVILERNPNYWGEAPQIERFIWRNIVDANSQLQAVQAGEADIAFSLDPDAVEQIRTDQNLQLLTGESISLEYLALHTQEQPGGPLANPQVRQAIAHAIDYDGIINGLLGGAGVRPATVVPLPMPGTEAVRESAYQTDTARAQELFDASGVGQIEITLTYGGGDQAQGGIDVETLATKIQSDIQRINGLTIRLNPVDPNQWIEDYRASTLQFTVAPWGPDFPHILSYVEPFGASTGVVAERVGFTDPQIDDLLAQVAAEQDPAQQEQLYEQVQRQLVELVPFIMLYQPTFQRPASRAVQSVTVHSLYGIQLRYASKSA